MKMSFSHWQNLFKKQGLVLVFFWGCGICLISGCSKKPTPPAATPLPVETPVAPGQIANPTTSLPKAAPTPVTQPDGQVDMPELQRSVIRWVVSNRRRPNNFEDFAATAGVTIPPPPAGKKYILTRDLHVQLVNR